MKIAIIGTGIAGNVAAYSLRQDHEITVFEAGSYVGGHTNTVDVVENGREFGVDTGFIVFNDRTYPNFIRLLDEIEQESQPSEMSFSVQAEAGGLEYCGSSLNGLFAQRKNILRPPFYRMIGDILRFNDEAVKDVDRLDATRTLGNYLFASGYSHEFVDHYLVPMAAAIWSAEPAFTATTSINSTDQTTTPNTALPILPYYAAPPVRWNRWPFSSPVPPYLASGSVAALWKSRPSTG